AADIYRQARAVASKTSRGTDGDWYREPDDLAWQWHIWFDGGREVASAAFSRLDNQWRPGPALPLASLTTAENASELLGELISTSYYSQKPKSLGVILHVADEFALAEMAQTLEAAAEGGEDFKILRYNLVDEPLEMLADREVSTDTTSWRLLPFWGAGPGQTRSVAMALSRAREPFMQKLMAEGEKMRLPVRVSVTSAPLEALAALPLIQPEARGGRLVVMPYLKYTAVFALSPEGELRAARSLSHRGGSLTPAGFGDILWNMAVAAELAGADHAGKPRLLLASSNQRAVEAAAKDLELYSLSRQELECEILDLGSLPQLAAIPGNLMELMIYDSAAIEQVRAGGAPLGGTETFPALWQGWAGQNFMDLARLDTLYPTLSDLRMLRFSTWFVVLLVFTLVSTGAYGTWSLFSAMNHPSWELTESQVSMTKAKHAKLIDEQTQIQLTEQLLLPRSRGWTTLEFLLQLFPEDSGVRLENFSYSLEAARSAASSSSRSSKGSKGKGSKNDATGLVRNWTIKGLVKPKALELLNSLNSQRGLGAFFEQVAGATDDPGFKPDPARQITVSLTQGRNSRYDSQATAADAARDPTLAFPFNFEIQISQTISEKDTLALPLEKPF
ncbi:MAG TPA: hypothetical protein DIT64_15400, partial [Verrucomicrobiales bacterium]|nr:hypothetical protein [Verrucomicrobiales bacterium]